MRRGAVLIPIYIWVGLSLFIHVLSYVGTNEVAFRFWHRGSSNRPGGQNTATRAPESVDFTYVPAVAPAAPPAPPIAPPEPSTTPESEPSAPPPVAAHVPPPPPPPQQPAPEQRAPERTPPRPQLDPRELLAHPAPQPPPPPAAAMPRPQQPPAQMQSVDQQRTDNQARPDNPAFLAQSNNNVQEQTIAAARNLNRDNANPQLGGSPSQNQGDQQGNGNHDVSADERDVRGDRNRVPTTTPNPPAHPTPPRPMLALNNSVRATPGAERSGPRGTSGPEGRAGRPEPAGAPGVAGAPGPAAITGVSEPVITAAQGPGGNESIGIPARGAGGTGAPGAGGQNGQGGTNGGGHGGPAIDRLGVRGRGVAGALAALTPTQSSYEGVYGPEAERERHEAQERRSETRGSYTESWRVNRAAIENYTPHVRVGSQTSLRTAQSPFAGYLTGMHRRIHRLFADGFLADIENLPTSNPLNDRSLVTTLEIILERDGRIHRLGVVRTSGNMAFDVASLNAVRRSAPFGSVPDPILSGDGRVYMHWAFYRNERQCGTFNAEPYILPTPGGTTPGRPTPNAPTPMPRDDRGDATPARREVPAAIAAR